MKKGLLYCFLLFISFALHAQQYLHGIIRDEKNKPIPYALVQSQSAKTSIKSDIDGSFGIVIPQIFDSIFIEMIGYEKLSLKVKATDFINITLLESADFVSKNKPKLISEIKNQNRSERFNPYISDETYFKLVENEPVLTNSFPNTSFSLNINKASYSNIRRFINMHSKVPPDAVRIEEMVNYFNLSCEQPKGKDIFNITSSITSCPWNTKNELLCIKLCAKKIDLEKLPASNLVFLIDVSGSMDMPNRLPLVKEAFQLFVKNMRPVDKVSIVTYGGMVGTWLAPTYGIDKETISNRIELLEAAGDTPGAYAIEMAYKLASANFIKGGNNRVILATDGDFNVGQTSEKALDELITKQRESGILLTCLGVGMGNFKDSKLQTLAKRGNGNYAYLDNLHEAEKVMVKELTETLYAVADDAFINIQFNPTTISSYRLIGYDNKKDAMQNGTSEIEGGEIGTGSNCMAIFEITPTIKNNHASIGALQLKYHDVKLAKGMMQEISYDIPNTNADTTNADVRFAAAVALFGLKLKETQYSNKATWKMVKATAEAAVNKNILLQSEFLKLVDKTIEVYEPSKKKRRD